MKLCLEGNNQFHMGKFKLAMELYQKALTYDQHWKLYRNIAQCYKKLRLFKEAVSYIQKAAKKNNENAELFRLGGTLAFLLFRNSEKISHGLQGQQYFKQALEITESETNLHNYMLSRKIIYMFKQCLQLEEKSELLEYLTGDNEEGKFSEEQVKIVDAKFLKQNYYDDVPELPEYLLCKIGLELMKDPVLTICGVTYEKDNILRSFEENGLKDPSTNEFFQREDCLIYNRHLKKHVENFILKNKWAYMGDDLEKNWKLFEFK